MDLIIVYINTLLYALLFLYAWRKNKKLGPSEVLLSIYVVVAVASIFLYKSEPYAWHLDVLNLGYLFIIISIFVKPIISDKVVEVCNCPISNIDLYTKISIGYIILAIYSCIAYIPQVYLALQNPEWADMYAESHEVVEGNIYTKLANLFFHFRYLGIVLFFSFLSLNKRINKGLIVFLGIAAFLPCFMVTLLHASRGGIIRLLISFILAYKMFEPTLSSNFKKRFYKLILVFLPIAFIYFMAVTNSRFEDNKATGFDSSQSALLSYLGQSMMTFDYGVMDSQTGFGHGFYMFDKPEWGSIKGTHFGSNFMTFVGCLYLDYAAFGTFLIAILVFFSLNVFLKKRPRGIPEIYVILYYLMYLFNGVFVHGLGYGNQWIEVIVTYFLLKLAEKSVKHN